MTRKLWRGIGALIPILWGLTWSVTSDAQEAVVPPPFRPTVDGNGVELVSGSFQFDRTDIVIGQPGAGGLTYGGTFLAGQPERRFLGTVTTVTYGFPVKTDYTVAIDNYAETFEKPSGSSTITSLEGKGSTLTEDASTFTYRSEGGLVAVFSKSLAVVHQIAAAHITSLTLPEGEVRTYHYVTATYAGGGSRTRLQSVTNNRGYQIKLLYQFNGTTIPVGQEPYFYLRVGAIGVNMAVDYCDPLASACTGLSQTWPSVTYNHGALTLAVVDVTGATASDYLYQSSGGPSTLSIRSRGSPNYDLVYTLDPTVAWRVTSVNRNGRIWNYAYSSTETELTTTVTDPQNRLSTYVFDATTRAIKRYTNTAGELAT
jgi:hypothetical protein